MNINAYSRLCRQDQRGFTLIEIMLALSLGLLVIAGILQIFASTKTITNLQEQISRVQENGRIATNLLNDNIRMAGYRSDAAMKSKDAFPRLGAFGQSRQVVSGIDDDPNNHNIDSITLRFQGSGDGVVTDCLGRTVNNNQTVTITLALSAIDPALGSRSLRCTSSIDAPGAAPSNWNSEPLIAGFEDMEIMYGVDTQPPRADSPPTAKTYLDATALNNTPLLWTRVVSVKVAVVAITADKMAKQPQTYTFPPWSNQTVTANDYRLRRVFSTTINLRNTNW